jgi:plasmid replication initiation protein
LAYQIEPLRPNGEEAAMSRFYGIHYRASIENGMVQGQNIGNYVVNKLKT